jgi:hypothetical protein
VEKKRGDNERRANDDTIKKACPVSPASHGLTCALKRARAWMKTAYLKVLSNPASTAICQTKRNMMAIPNPVNATPTFPKKDASDNSTISTPDAMALQQ